MFKPLRIIPSKCIVKVYRLFFNVSTHFDINYIAVDKDGSINVFEEIPKIFSGEYSEQFYWESKPYKRIGRIEYEGDWKDSLTTEFEVIIND